GGGVAPAGGRERGAGRSGLRLAAGALVAGAVLAAATTGPAVPAGPGSAPLGVGATARWGGGAVVVEVDGRASGTVVLGRLRAVGLPRVDVVVARSRAVAVGDVVDALRRRWPSALVLAPGAGPGDRPVPALADAVVPPAGTVLDVGGLRITVRSQRDGRLDAEIAPATRALASPVDVARPLARSPAGVDVGLRRRRGRPAGACPRRRCRAAAPLGPRERGPRVRGRRRRGRSRPRRRLAGAAARGPGGPPGWAAGLDARGQRGGRARRRGRRGDARAGPAGGGVGGGRVGRGPCAGRGGHRRARRPGGRPPGRRRARGAARPRHRRLAGRRCPRRRVGRAVPGLPHRAHGGRATHPAGGRGGRGADRSPSWPVTVGPPLPSTWSGATTRSSCG